MQQSERPEFDGHVSRLCAAFNVPPTPERLGAYWDAFKNLGLIEIARMMERALSERGPDKFPTVPAMWEIRRKLKAVTVMVSAASTRNVSRHAIAVNLLFFGYLNRRRVIEAFTGDLNIPERRRECVELIEFFEELEAERDPTCTLVELRKRFRIRMERVKDAPGAAIEGKPLGWPGTTF
jgi:hypothetical protein